jgi:hypothetical protein
VLKIRRSKPAANFTILPNELLRDDRLTYCARGVLVELLSRPSGWETNADALSERARRHRGDVVGEGRRGLRAAFAELERANSSALAGARAGQLAGPRDRRREELNRLYEAANDLDDDRLRRLLLQLEKKRPRIYREQRQSAIGQLERESPAILKGPDSARSVDLLSYKYALVHYSADEKPLPDWLVRFPR